MTDFSFSKYIADAQRTNSDQVGQNGQWTLDFMHGAAGLITELRELDEAEDKLNSIEELGDCFWFIALMCHSINYHPKLESNGRYYPIYRCAINLIDDAKRWFAYGYDKDSESFKG